MMEDAIRKVLEDLFNLQPLMPNPNNRRSILISISPQGGEILRQYKEKQIRHLTPYFAQLSADELATLHHSFQEITQIMRKLHYKENDNQA